jgi:hypothetical protein
MSVEACIADERTAIRAGVGGRTMHLGRVAGIAVLLVGLAEPAFAMPPLLIEIGAYVGGTGTITTAILKFVNSSDGIYSGLIVVMDEQTCRRHKASLNELVLDLRDVEAENRHFLSGLDSLINDSPNNALVHRQTLRTASNNVISDIRRIQAYIRQARQDFSGSAAISRPYTDLLQNLEEKAGVLDQFQSIHWDESAASAMQDRLTGLQQIQALRYRFSAWLDEFSSPINALADLAGKPCKPPSG